MERIFISSLVRGEMGAIRQAARRAVEALEMYPVMLESGAASDEGSRRALLDRVAGSDALLLLLGAEYGEPAGRGVSPTEEEFNEARERGVPVLALVQDTTRQPAQEEFLGRVRGTWEAGRLTADFTDARAWSACRGTTTTKPEPSAEPRGCVLAWTPRNTDGRATDDFDMGARRAAPQPWPLVRAGGRTR